MKKIIILSVICLFSIQAFAQNDAQFTQFYANRLFHNPAATGASDKFLASVTHRTQWIGSAIKNQLPNYTLFSATQYFAEKRSGVGLTVYNAKHNVQQNLQIKGSYAYHLQVQDEAWLSMGINVGFLRKGIKDGIPIDGPVWNSESYTMSDLGIGVEYYTPELIVGVSCQHIPELILGAKEQRQHVHFYYYTMYFYTINEEWKVIPSVALRNSSFFTNVDVSARVSYLNMFQFGLSWRRDAVALLLGFSFQDTYSIGYSFDLHTGNIYGVRPSHEIVLGYRTQIINAQDTRLQRITTASRDF